MLHPAKVSTPATAALVLDGVQLRAPLPGGLVPMARVMLAVELVTVLPPASCTVTTGWVPQATLRAPPPGWVVNASWLAAPTVMLNVLLVAEVSEPLVAVRV